MDRLRDLLITSVCQLLSIPFSRLSRPLPKGRSFPSIVIIKPCCIGDVVLATSAVTALRNAYPDSRLTFCVSSWARDAIRDNPRIDELIECGNVGSGRGYGWREYLSLIRRIRQGSFELAVVLDRSPLLSLIPLLAGIPHRAGIDSSGRGFSLTVKTPWRANHHEAELYLDVVRELGIPVGRARAEFHVAEEDDQRTADILAEVWSRTGRSAPSGKMAMIHPGGAANPGMVLSAKRWLPERYAELACRLLREGWVVLLVGAPSDRSAADLVKDRMDAREGRSTGDQIIDLVGELSLGQMAAVARRCGVFVGNDTGPMHIVAAVGTPTIAIFGPSTPDMYAPCGPNTTVVYNKVDCSPCFVKGRFDSSCRDHRCMRAVEVDEVWQAVRRAASE